MKILGYLILVVILGSMFEAVRRDVGLKQAIYIWGTAIAGTGLIALGTYLVVNG